ncbi:MAG: hypothetical protein QM635_12300, partial [Microbacteriaceae bacterium]
MRVLALADSDSYVKWGAAMLDRMPPEWDRALAVVASTALPTPAQLVAALAGTSWAGRTPVLTLAALRERVARERPDVVVLAVRGPVVRVLVREVLAAAPAPRPVLVSGLPGVSIPATYQALYYRSQADLVLLHSRRELRAFAGLALQHRMPQRFALASLPFLGAGADGAGADGSARVGTDIVFAAQAKVPALLRERRELVRGLVDVARTRPDRRVVLKLRGLAGDPQTHAERHPFDTLLAELAELPPNVVIDTGPMAARLESAAVLATISSTAAIEAIARGVPVLLIDDFGVSGGLINLVYTGSGLFGPVSALAGDGFAAPASDWLEDNYLHPPEDADWLIRIEEAVRRRDAGELPLRRQFRGRLGGPLRRAWDRKNALGHHDRSLTGRIAFVLVAPLRAGVRRARALRGRLGRRPGRRPG